MSAQEQEKTPGSWDRGLDFDATREMLKAVYGDTDVTPRKRTYTAVLLIQLRNGSRVSEALSAYNLGVLLQGAAEMDAAEAAFAKCQEAAPDSPMGKRCAARHQ